MSTPDGKCSLLSARRWLCVSKKAPPLTKLLKKGDFVAIDRYLHDSSICTDSWFSQDYSLFGENCLHLLLQYRPPANVVRAMLEQYRKVRSDDAPHLTVDYFGRTPLHISLIHHNTPDVVELLASKEDGKSAAMAVDSNHRLPLHEVVISYHDTLEPRKRQFLVKDGLKIEDLRNNIISNAAILLDVFPEALSVRDRDHSTPLEYLANAPPEARKLTDQLLAAKSRVRAKAPVPLLDILDIHRLTLPRVPSEISLDADDDAFSSLT